MGLGKVLSFLLVVGIQSIAWAGLGRDHSEIETRGSKNLRFHSHQKSVQAHFTVHKLVSNRQTIYEYEGADGKIFAVTWHGSHQPDLNYLLGDYVQEHSQALQTQARKTGVRRSSQISSTNVIVERNSVGGQSNGRAYLPANMPVGVSPNDLQ